MPLTPAVLLVSIETSWSVEVTYQWRHHIMTCAIIKCLAHCLSIIGNHNVVESKYRMWIKIALFVDFEMGCPLQKLNLIISTHTYSNIISKSVCQFWNIVLGFNFGRKYNLFTTRIMCLLKFVREF